MADPENQPAVQAEDVEEIEVEEEADAGAGEGQQRVSGLANQLMQNPEVLAALQGSLQGIVGQSSGYIESLPKAVKRRLKALKKLQFEATKIEAKFYEEVHELECKYATKYAPLYERRRDIIGGNVEPTDSDCDWPSDTEDEKEDELAEAIKAKVTIEDESKGGDGDEQSKEEEPPTGVPQFWLTTLKNIDMIASMIQEHDEPILKHLTEVKVKFMESDPMGFVLEFYFDANDFFGNNLLTKTYFMSSQPDESDPFGFEGPEIVKCQGCSIDWKKNMNVTVKTIKKKQKHKGRGTTRTITKTVQNDSFFNFFNPPAIPEGEEEIDEDTEEVLSADYEIGHFIRERVIPKAILYFTGEALEVEEFEEEAEEEEQEGAEGEHDDDDENDPDYKPPPGEKPNECKSQ